MKTLVISVLSFVLTSAVIANAYIQKKQYYPAVVYISKSNPRMLLMYFQGFIIAVAVAKQIVKIFFGELRAVEREHVTERAWYAITETCLAFAVFKNDFTPKFVALFTLLFFLKIFHWLAEEKVDFMERSPVISPIFHIRMLSSFFILGALDITFIIFAYQSTFSKGISSQIVFGFEYALLLTTVLNFIIKYILHAAEIHRQIPWEHKAVFLMYTDFLIGLQKVILYAAFIFIMVQLLTLPLFAFRSIYYTLKDLNKAITDIIMSRRAIRNMNTMYPDATPEELDAFDNVCIICREEMNEGSTAKKLPCNHIFHSSCLRSWFQRQQTCPTCRLNVLTFPSSQRNLRRRQSRRQRTQGLQQNPNISGLGGAENQINPNSSQTATGGNPSSVSNSTPVSSNHPGNFQIFYPTFPYTPPNWPAPPLNFNGLSEEELRNLERLTSEGLEARIRCLQNATTLVNAAVLLLQQCQTARSANLQSQSTQTSQDNNLPDHDLGSSPELSGNTSTVSSITVPTVNSTELPKDTKIDHQNSSMQELIRQRRLEVLDKMKQPNVSE